MAEKKGFDPTGLINAGIGAVSSLFGIGEKRQDRRQIEQQRKLNAMDLDNARIMRDMQMQTWHDTNYGAQVKEAKEAGLSMSIFGKGGGSSGATMGSPAMTDSGDASNAAMAQQAATTQGMTLAQMGLMKAQKENIEADTANKVAEAENKGVNTESGKVDLAVKTATQNDAIKQIAMDAEKARNEMVIAHNKAQVGTATQQNEIEGLKAEYTGKILENVLKKTKTDLNIAEVKAVARRLIQKDEEISISKFVAEMNGAFPGIDKVLGRTVNDTIQGIFDLFKSDRDKQKQRVQ